MVEMGGLEPPAPYMRSKEIDWPGPCCIRVFGPLGRLPPLLSPRRTVDIDDVRCLCHTAKQAEAECVNGFETAEV
jgi:hypothetical protein